MKSSSAVSCFLLIDWQSSRSKNKWIYAHKPDCKVLRLLQLFLTTLVVLTVTEVDKFISVGQNSLKMQKHGLTVRPLEAAKSIRKESLPPTVVKGTQTVQHSEFCFPCSHFTYILIRAQQAVMASQIKTSCFSSCTNHMYLYRIPLEVFISVWSFFIQT